MTEQFELLGTSRGWRSWQPATRDLVVALLIGLGAAAAGRAVSHVGGSGQLVLVAGFLSGTTLATLLWFVTCLCAVIVGVKGFRVLVIGYEAFTGALAALFLCVFILAACGGVLVTGFLTLLTFDRSAIVLYELGRPLGDQIVVQEPGGLHGSGPWSFYVGGPFVFDEIPDPPITAPDCALLSDEDRTTTFAAGEYVVSTDERGRDVLTFTIDGRPCEDGDAGEDGGAVKNGGVVEGGSAGALVFPNER